VEQARSIGTIEVDRHCERKGIEESFVVAGSTRQPSHSAYRLSKTMDAQVKPAQDSRRSQ
jgi:hypothetical protein